MVVVDDTELDRLDRDKGGGVVILNKMAFFGVVGSRSMGDINPQLIGWFGAGEGVNGEPRVGSVVSSDDRQARLFWRSRGGGRRELSVSVLDGLKRVREGERRQPNDSSLELGDDGLLNNKVDSNQSLARRSSTPRRALTNPRTSSTPSQTRPASD